ncbi:MAG: M24 family metallopeptidase [Alphaproteobacteria bacterium]|jgi:Xaa-Pro dipeptidase|tara:strand:+ start:6866 stop:8071 length:1206 start_codon:yes stop_codon:yes gene_type:complete
MNNINYLNKIGERELQLLNSDYPEFSSTEYENRRILFESAMLKNGTDEISDAIIYEAGNSGSAIQWLTGWPVTQEALLHIGRGEKLKLYIEHYNHLPMAEILVHKNVEVIWGERSLSNKIISNIVSTIPKTTSTLGVVGRLTINMYNLIRNATLQISDMNKNYISMRLIKSEEELSWIKIGAAMTDNGISSMVNNIQPGITQHELSHSTQSAYIPLGGNKVINFFGITPMDNPNNCVPSQFTSNQKIKKNDIISTEISAHFWNYPGQILRTISLGPMTSIYKELHAVADEVFLNIRSLLKDGTHASEIIEASKIIEKNGYSIWDDLIHGYGGGYLPPVLGTTSRPADNNIDFVFKEGMTVVLQPNIITEDHKSGVQTGELLLIKKDSCERLHNYPTGAVEL